MCEGLIRPRSYREATPEERASVSNGCGPQSMTFDVVPDNLLGLDIGCCCDIHDWMYEHGSTIQEKHKADHVFYWNMLRLIDREGGWLRWPRRFMAWWYLQAVVAMGHDSFKG